MTLFILSGLANEVNDVSVPGFDSDALDVRFRAVDHDAVSPVERVSGEALSAPDPCSVDVRVTADADEAAAASHVSPDGEGGGWLLTVGPHLDDDAVGGVEAIVLEVSFIQCDVGHDAVAECGEELGDPSAIGWMLDRRSDRPRLRLCIVHQDGLRRCRGQLDTGHMVRIEACDDDGVAVMS